MSLVFCIRYPFQVFDAVVGRIPINVIYLRLVFWIWDESLSDQAVNLDDLLLPRRWLQVKDQIFPVQASFAP